MALRTIDVDQHLFESRTAWAEHIDPAHADDALGIEDDERGWPWLTWRGTRLYPVEIQHPGHPEEVGERRASMARGERAPGRYEDLLPAAYGGGAGRVASLDEFGLDATVLFPNFGLIWEEMLARRTPSPASRASSASSHPRSWRPTWATPKSRPAPSAVWPTIQRL